MAAREQIHLFGMSFSMRNGSSAKAALPYSAVFSLVALPQPPEALTGYQGTPAIYVLVACIGLLLWLTENIFM